MGFVRQLKRKERESHKSLHIKINNTLAFGKLFWVLALVINILITIPFPKCTFKSPFRSAQALKLLALTNQQDSFPEWKTPTHSTRLDLTLHSNGQFNYTEITQNSSN